MIRLAYDHWVHADDILSITISPGGDSTLAVRVRLAWFPDPQLHSEWTDWESARTAAEALSRDVDRARRARL